LGTIDEGQGACVPPGSDVPAVETSASAGSGAVATMRPIRARRFASSGHSLSASSAAWPASRQRRSVYEALAKTPDGLSTKDLLADVEMSEPNLRESLRKLDAAGLIMRVGRLWTAVPLGAEDPPSSTPEPA